MQINTWKIAALSDKQRQKIIKRSEIDISAVATGVQEILDGIRERGDAALIEYIHRFDGVDLTGRPFRVTEEEFLAAEASISREVKEAIAYAVENVRRFHKAQFPEAMTLQAVRPGVYAGEKASPVPSAGLYVPRGKGSFPSMLYMLAVPAVVAGVPRIVVVSPPDKEGKVDAGTLYTAKVCGVTEVYRVGGPMAIAALAYGTESLPEVEKILGPGNSYVTTAKRLLSGVKDFGLPAGPSDSAVLADAQADPRKVAMDLLVEAEHGSDSAAILVTPSPELAAAVGEIIPGLVSELSPRRRGFVQDVLKGYGGILIAADMEEAIDFINDFAPEHLQINTRDPFDLLDKITNAGEILLGENGVFSLANYAVGANAVLPTGGKAKTYSPLSVRDFMKFSSVVYISGKGYRELKDPVIKLADYEGFEAHGAALKKR